VFKSLPSAVRLALSALLVVALSLSTRAQTGTTSLHGTVIDQSHSAIVGANVTLLDLQKGQLRTAPTGNQGEYGFESLTPGTYTLTVEMPSFRKYERRNLQLLVNQPETMNVTLEVGSASQVVEVSAQTATLNTSDASLGNAFGENQVKALPMEGRNVPDLLTLQPGVAYLGNRTDVDRNVDTRSGAVNGARSDQSNLTLDGVDVNDQVNGNAFTSVLPVSLDSVQEFRVTTTNANADQGGSSGAQVSLVTKSGTNAFHGSLYEYNRNTFTSANDYFVKLAELQQGQPNTPPKLIRNIFGGSLGGPILKDRLFFFINYEAARQREEASVIRIVPSDSLRAGIIRYVCDTNDPSCAPGNPNVNVVNTSLGPVVSLSPAQIKGMDPLSIGANQVMLNYFNSFPVANDLSQGDTLNFVGYRFKGATPINKNWYIARADYKITKSGSHTLFWRGALRNDISETAPYLPGTRPEDTLKDYSKGYVVGYTGVLKPTLINSFHFGFTRQSSGDIGNNDTTPVIEFRGLNDNSTSNGSSQAFRRSQSFQTPVYNITDDISWTRGKHTLQFGTNIRFIRSPRTNFLSSFSAAVTNSSGLDTAGIAGTRSPLDPGNNGFPAVDPNSGLDYDYPMIALMGIVSEVDGQFNFDKTGTALPQGAALTRRYGDDEYEFYAQDSWRIKPNFTLTYGLRYSLFSPPWETNGVQVAPSVTFDGKSLNLSQWFNLRADKAAAGESSVDDPLISYSLAGPANGKTGYYGWDYHDFGPRVSFAYSPRASGGLLGSLFGNGDKTVIRGGFGIVYDRFGAGLLSTFDQNGAFGLSTSIPAPIPCVGPSVSDPCTGTPVAPRLTSLTTIPQTDFNNNPFFPATPTGGFPFTYPPAGTALAIQWGLDSGIKTPYEYTIDFSVGRQLPGNMSLEVSYVGRLSHRLLGQEDLAMPLNIKDPKTGVDYFTAMKALAKLGFAGTPTSAVTSASVGATSAYWKNIVKPLATGDSYSLACDPTLVGVGSSVPGFTTDVVQAMYSLDMCGGGKVNGFGDETTPLAQLDYWGSDFGGTAGILGASGNYYGTIFGPNAFFNSQFHSLRGWRNLGTANYNAMQVVLRKRLSHGVQFDFNYTYSKSIDLSSNAERITVDGSLNIGGLTVNSWSPYQLRGVSDFDTTHQFNTNWLIDLPFGKGRAIAHDAHGFTEAVIGGWQLSGLARWTSGFPVTLDNSGTWPTNWQLEGAATLIGPAPSTHTTQRPDGSVNLFAQPLPVTDVGLGPFRHDLPGESGNRNPLRGPGFAGLDLGLSKRWKMPWAETHNLLLRWEVFNALNLTRFDVGTINNNISSASFGNYSGLLTNPRVMQFALRYEF
jgi:hypothetical protein